MTEGNPGGSEPDPARLEGLARLEDPFVRFNARVLDPTTAGKLVDGSPASATAYVSNRLIVTADTEEAARQLLGAIDDALAGTGMQRSGGDPFQRQEGDDPAAAEHNDLAELLNLAIQTDTPVCFPVTVESTTEQRDGPAPEDVWPVLRRLRGRESDRNESGEIGLDHLMFAAANILGNPVHPIATALVFGNPVHPIANALAEAGYEQPGFGGHGPVSLVIGAPDASGGCAPRVVVLDTGVGAHDWFTAPHAEVEQTLQLDDGRYVGMDVTDPVVDHTNPEGAGAVPDRMTGLLATHAGHGTFITGLLRQKCPDAHITSLRVMDADGVVPEWDLSKALMSLGIKLKQQEGSIDALVLSLGYYPETGDRPYVAGQKRQLLTLAQRGVVTFAAAGNDCTQRPSYPAAFAVEPEFNLSDAGFAHRPTMPMRSVAALNPDRSTVALFSNDGTWVNGEAVGANLVSTAPKFTDGSYQSVISVVGPNGRRRSTIDQDDYSSGFAVWSGTSFAAPVLAAKYLSKLVKHDCPTDVSIRRGLVPLRVKHPA